MNAATPPGARDGSAGLAIQIYRIAGGRGRDLKHSGPCTDGAMMACRRDCAGL
jgi:hypothetical protein